MRSVLQCILFAALQPAGIWAFSVEPRSVGPTLMTSARPSRTREPTNIFKMSYQDEQPEGQGPDMTPPPEMMSTPPPQQQQPLDPLIASLTRDDTDPRESADAPTTNIPLLGEVTLDKDLFVVAPIAAFAVLGILSFFLVLANSGDAIVQALNDVNEAVLNPQTPQPVDTDVCRGLCSNQAEDIEGLRNVMNSLGGKR